MAQRNEIEAMNMPEPLGEAKPSRLNKTMLKEEISKGNVLVSNNLRYVG